MDPTARFLLALFLVAILVTLALLWRRSVRDAYEQGRLQGRSERWRETCLPLDPMDDMRAPTAEAARRVDAE